MTDYQKIETELIRLGWTKRQGNGDHVKFTKPDVPHIISVSRAISSGGRSYNNMLADIRRWEPMSTLGRQTKSKMKQMSEDISSSIKLMTEEEKAYSQTKKYIYPGASVRYTAPEGKDYRLLNDEGTVMSQEYVVREIQHGSEMSLYVKAPDDIITISLGDEPPIEVFPDDIESYDLITCTGCGRTVPASHLYQATPDITEREQENDDEIFFTCDSCMAKEERLHTIISRITSLPDRYKKVNSKIVRKKMEELSEYTRSFNLADNENVLHITDEQIKSLSAKIDQAEKELKTTPSASRAATIKRKPNIYDIFNNFRQKVAEALDGENARPISELTYSVSPDVKSLLIITAGFKTTDRSRAIYNAIFNNLGALFSDLRQVFPPDRICVELRYPAIGYDQLLYAPEAHDFFFNKVCSVMDEDEFMEKSTMMRSLSDLHTPSDIVLAGWKKCAAEHGLDGILTTDNIQCAYGSVNGKPALIWSALTTITNGDYLADTPFIEKMSACIRKTQEYLGDHLVSEWFAVSIHEPKSGKTTEWSAFNNDSDYGPDAFSLKEKTVEWTVPESIDTAVRLEMELKDLTLKEILSQMYNSYMEKEIKPAAPAATSRTDLKAYDTKELLHELISRGVHMENVQIPVIVMQTVNLEDL